METPQQDPVTEETGAPSSVITSEVMGVLRSQQDLKFAIIGGASAAIVGALLWAVITVTTQYQIGYMAIGVGLLVGFSVRHFGMGIDKHYGIVGGVFALIGCALGNLLSQVGFAAQNGSLTYMQIISVLNFELIVELFSESFSPMDVLFYGIAIYQGYKFSFRTFSDELLQEIAEGRVPRSPFEKYRIPIASTLFIGLLVISYFITSANSGMRTNYYESGAKLSSGEISGGKETGVWEFYDESGNIVSKGNFTEGKQDGTWEFFDESGVRYRRGTFSKNIAHGEWIDYHKNGKVASTGNYTNGRQTGPWVYYYENGNVMRKGEMKMDKMHGEWETYHENGKLNSRLNYFRAEPVGNATHWNEDGEKVRESVYKDGIETIINLWDSVGKPQIVNGSGTYTGVYDDGSIREKGQYHNGYKTGIWDSYYPNGERQETGEFRNGVYFLQQSWSPSGIEDVKQGSGDYKLYADTIVLESGRIQDGLRVGVWSKYLPDGVTVWSEYNYVQGKLEGKNTIFFSDGTVNVEGIMKADKQDGEWIWYYENGNVETRATFRNGIKEGDQIFYTDAGDHIRTEQYKDGECVKVVIDEEL